MPSWKKVIISGSDAALNSLDITQDLTVDTNTLYVNSSNNRVGIGTTSPESNLHVFKGESSGAVANTESTLVLENNSNTYVQFLTPATDESGLLFGDTDNDVGAITYDHSTNRINFRTNAVSNRMVIDSSGNVGIGNTNPSQKLTVEGDITGSGYVKGSTLYALNDVVVGDQILHYGDTDTNLSFTTDKIQINAGGVEMITLTEGAADNVHINAGAVDMDFKVSTDNDNDALFVEGSTDRVGIGTGTPSRKLHIAGTGGTTGGILLAPSSGDIEIQFQDAGTTNAYITLEDGTQQMRLRDDSADVLNVDFGTERVGVMTTTPSAPLDVNGNASISGSLTVSQGGNITMDGGGTLDTGGGSLDTSGGSIDTNGGNISLGIGALNGTIPGSAVNVDTVTATVKNFVIDHPTPEKEGYKLRHSSLEGPEIGVYFRGKSTSNIIDLPDYWADLVEEESITVNLTPFGSSCQHYIEDIRDNQVIIGCACGTPNYHFTVYGERKDVEKLVVEYKEEKYL